MQATIETTAKTVDGFLDKALVAQPTPWFLKAEDLYLLAKKALSDLKLGDYTVVQRAIAIVDKSTEALVGEFTSYTVEEGFSVIKVIDETLATYCPKADTAIDATHVKFLDALKGLKVATKTQVEAIYSKLSVEEAKAYAVSMATGTYVLAKEKAPAAVETVEALLAKATDVVGTTKNKVDEMTASATEYAKGTYAAAGKKVIATKDATIEIVTSKVEEARAVGADVLKQAEPYGKAALDVSKPYVMKAVEISTPVVTPLVVRATPYVTPYVEYAKKTIEGNEAVAPIYKSVEKIVGDAQAFYSEKPDAAPVSTPAPITAE